MARQEPDDIDERVAAQFADVTPALRRRIADALREERERCAGVCERSAALCREHEKTPSLTPNVRPETWHWIAYGGEVCARRVRQPGWHAAVEERRPLRLASEGPVGRQGATKRPAE